MTVGTRATAAPTTNGESPKGQFCSPLRIQNCGPPLLPQQSAQTPWTVGLIRPQCGQGDLRASLSRSALPVVRGGPSLLRVLGRENADDVTDGLGRIA
jgi:hypothetical protein